MFYGDADGSEKIAVIQEYLGACLLGKATYYQKALVFVGKGASGKGVLSEIAEAIMHSGSVCAVAPQDLEDQYRRALLAGKRLNIVSKLPETDLLDSESWKSIVSGDSTTARQIRQEPFTFRPVAGHIYSSNRLPGTTDHTHGFWRRLIVIDFNRVFTPDEQDPELASHLLGELSAIVSWALEGARRLIERGKFLEPKSSTQALESWRKQADQGRAFVEDQLERLLLDASTHEFIRAQQLYQRDRARALDNGHRPLASNQFGQRMKLLNLPSRKLKAGAVYPVRLKVGAL